MQERKLYYHTVPGVDIKRQILKYLAVAVKSGGARYLDRKQQVSWV